MANFDFEGLLSNPAFQMGLGILGNNNTENTAQVLGRGGLMGLQNYQQQKQRDDFNKIRQSQVDVMKQRQDREDSELDMQKQVIAEASAKFPDQALLFQLDPQAAVKALYPQANQQDPYFTPVYDSERGLGSFNARTGETSWQGGQPIIKPEHDPRLQGDLAYSKQFGKGRATPTDMEDGVIQTEAQLIKRLGGGLPSDVPRLPQGQPQSNAWQIPPELQAQRDIAAKELIAAEGGQGDMGVTPPMPYNLPRGGIRVPTKAEEAAAVEAAKLSTKSLAEDKSILKEMERSLPNLENVVSELSDLGKKATYTTTGRIVDSARRELGMGVGERAIARKEYIAKVANEILPLLRQTFGAAFTEREGESLKATLGDPNSSPEEKDAVLRAFIATKRSQLKEMKGTILPTDAQMPAKVRKYNPATGKIE